MLKYRTLKNHFDISSFLAQLNENGWELVSVVKHRKEILIFYKVIQNG